MKTYEIAVIGAGAAGMMAAITAAMNGAEVLVIEHTDKIGKKILATGNGKCNYTNLYQDESCYRSNTLKNIMEVIRRFDEKRTIEFFNRIGIVECTKNGYVYPNSLQASSVNYVLSEEMRRLCTIKTLVNIKGISKKKNFIIDTDRGIIEARKVILATGSMAAKNTGSDGSGYNIAKMLGHKITKVVPALVQLRSGDNFCKGVAGVRVQGRVTLISDGEVLAEDYGEIQLTDYGVSGIPVFQISRYAAYSIADKKKTEVVINFEDNKNEYEVYDFLSKRIELMPHKTAEGILRGYMNDKLALALLNRVNIKRDTRADALSKRDLHRLAGEITGLRLAIEKTNPYENAQICAGGVDMREVDVIDMQSKITGGLYFAGEILDVDGICGGYNLQWAWTSGHIAGMEAADSVKS